MRPSLRPLILAFLAACAAAPAARADAVADFYAAHPLSVLIGFSTGNSYDIYGRFVAQHISKYLPGHPTVLPVNMPGAGGLVAALHLYNTAPRDGSAIAIFNRSNAMEPLLGASGARFDPRRFGWIGSVGSETSLCVAWHSSPVKSWADLFAHDLVVGATSLSADTGVFPLILKNLFQARIKLVTGYPGGGEIEQAMESGEVDGRCGWSWSSIVSTKAAWLAERKISLLVQMGSSNDPALQDVPAILALAKTERERQILKLVLARETIAWPLAAPPEVPPDRLAALRKAFLEALADPAAKAEARRMKLAVEPVSGEAAQALIGEVYATPAATVAEAKAMINGK